MNFAIFRQSLKQMWGIIVLEYRYHGNLPAVDTYRCKVKYSLPFHGQWVAVNGGVVQEVSHSWEIPTQRYAYDFIILDGAGRSFCGDETDAASFYCYGQDILAPADGTVIEVGQGSPDSDITPNRDVSCKARDMRGNYILLRHAEKEYSLLAHLQPGSIRVSVGSQVRRGEEIARCGNSGNTTEPHLHFQLQADTSFYMAPGLPIEFEDIIAEPAPNYKQFDDRKVPEPCKAPSLPYITRGQAVRNTKRCL